MRGTCLFGVVSFLVLVADSRAQPQVTPMPHPRLLVVTPPGGKAGSTVEIVINGQEFEAPQSLLFSTPGIKAEPAVAPPAEAKKPAPNQPAITTLKFKV